MQKTDIRMQLREAASCFDFFPIPHRRLANLRCRHKSLRRSHLKFDLDVMRSDAERLREDRPTVLVSLREQPDAGPIAEWVTALVAARRG